MKHIQNIALAAIPHKEQRYKTVGDWFQAHPVAEVQIRSSQLSDWRYEFLILVHELVEWGLCKYAGVSQKAVDEFDEKHENEQNEVELGDLKDAPYRTEHCIATAVERLLAAATGVCWSDYEAELNRLMLME